MKDQSSALGRKGGSTRANIFRDGSEDPPPPPRGGGGKTLVWVPKKPGEFLPNR